MKPIYISILTSMSGYVFNRLDKQIDTPAEREAMAKIIIKEIEDKIGDIPFMDDSQEINTIVESLVLVHKGLSSINKLLNTFEDQ